MWTGFCGGSRWSQERVYVMHVLCVFDLLALGSFMGEWVFSPQTKTMTMRILDRQLQALAYTDKVAQRLTDAACCQCFTIDDNSVQTQCHADAEANGRQFFASRHPVQTRGKSRVYMER